MLNYDCQPFYNRGEWSSTEQGERKIEAITYDM